MDLVKWHSNERVNIGDFRKGTGLLALYDHFRQARNLVLPAGRTTGQANTGGRILSGFGATIPGGAGVGNTVQLDDGSGIFPFRDSDGTLHHGLVLGEASPASYIIDFSAAGVGTYSVFVRAVHSDSSHANRVFWNAATPAEELGSVATVQEVVWEYVVQDSALASPGDEYVKLYEVVVGAGPVVSSVTEFRHLFFEGSAHATDDYAFEWGDGIGDRDSDRGAYGIGDIHMVLQAVRRQLADIIGDPQGAHEWQKAPPIELESLHQGHWSEADNPTYAGFHKATVAEPFALGDESGPGFWQIVANANALSLTGVNAAVLHTLLMNSIAAADNEFAIAPRGVGTDMQNSDKLTLYYGDTAARALEVEITKQATDNFHIQEKCNGSIHTERFVGSGTATPYHAFDGEVRAGRGFRLSAPATTDGIVIPLQWATETHHGAAQNGWVFEQAGGMTGVPAELNNAGYNDVECWFCLTLPHQAVVGSLMVMWEQAAAGGGVELRMYAQKHTMSSVTPGLIGGGTGAPSNYTSLATPNDYIQHQINGLGGSSPYNMIQLMTFNTSAAARTFDATTDQLIIGFKAPDAGSVNCKVYWLRLQYDLDYVTPPLV
jgi:hypothetical protein